jgi:hypothetical protein
MKRLFSLLLAVVLAACTVSAQDGNVRYSGEAGEFIFAPGSTESPTDLFPNFKDVMPGDELHQRILIRNDASKDVKIKVYMRALGAQEGSEDFLSKLNLRVEQLVDTELFNAPADQTAQLTDWTYLGLIYSGGVIELDVVLEVPTSLDNQDKNQMGLLEWEFMIEEFPVEETDPDIPDTGDHFHIGIYIAGFMVCSGGLLLLLLPRRKDEEEQ